MSTVDRICRAEHTAAAAGRRHGSAAWIVAALGLTLATPASGDDAKARQIAANVCAACHGLDGNSTIPTYPKLAGRHPDYLARELNHFLSGKRKSDIMAPIAAALDPDDIEALAEYFGAQKPSAGVVLDPVASAAGRRLYEDGNEQTGVPACGGCHGADASGNKRFPRLAGQHREYLLQQLYNFRNDLRNHDAARFMRAVAKRMSEDEIKAVVEYLAGL